MARFLPDVFKRMLSQALAFIQTSGIGATPEKSTVIRLRWPLVIFCSYLLLYSTELAAPNKVMAFMLFYLVSNGVLYFLDKRLFASRGFYGPLVIFDTVCLIAALAMSGQASADFYIAGFLTIILCCLARDISGLCVIAILGPVVYGSFLSTSTASDPSLYLRLLLPFAVSLFYGYFAQVELSQRRLGAQLKNQAQEQSRAHSDLHTGLHEITLAITSTLELRTILDLLLREIASLFPVPTVIVVRLLNRATGGLEAAAYWNINEGEWQAYTPDGKPGLGRYVLEKKAPVVVTNTLEDPRTRTSDFFRRHGLRSYLGLPLIAQGEVIGEIEVLTKTEYPFSQEEVQFLGTVASPAAIAIHNSRLYERTKDQAVEMEKSNKVKTELLCITSHELRTPLNVIMGYTGIVKDGMLGAINDKQEEMLEKVICRTYDLLSMVDGILYATSLEARAMRVEAKLFSLNYFLNELQLDYAIHRSKSIRLTWDYPPDLPPMIGDVEKLRHILRNLINNALKYTDHGTVNVAVRIKERSTAPDNENGTEEVEFKVSDTGIGISREALTSIFEMFRQVDSSKTRPSAGVGLGLYIVKQFTEMLRGKIEVDSEPGKGSTFTVTLPLDVKRSKRDGASTPASVGRLTF